MRKKAKNELKRLKIRLKSTKMACFRPILGQIRLILRVKVGPTSSKVGPDQGL